jgi:hypothetical protein
MNQVKGKRLIRYRIGVYAVVSSEQSGQKWFVGEFVTCAPSERKAVSNLRFRYGLRDYDEGNAEVSYMFEVNGRMLTRDCGNEGRGGRR